MTSPGFDTLPIKFNEKCLPEKYAQLIITTDLEPDDLIAIELLLQKLPPWQKLLIFVGGGSISKKHLMKQMLEIHGMTSYYICDADRSDAEYPVELFTIFGPAITLIPPLDTDIADGLNMFLRTATNPLIIALKPVKELLLIDPAMRSKTTVAMYGSFNFRSLDCESDTLTAILKQFKRIVLYESFLSTVKDSSNSVPADNLMFKVMKYRANISSSLLFDNRSQFVWKGIESSIKIWNIHITKKMLRKIASIAQHLLKEWFVRKMDDYNIIIERNNSQTELQWENSEIAVTTMLISAGVVKEAAVNGDRSEKVIDALAELFATSKKLGEDLFNESKKCSNIDEPVDKLMHSLDRSLKIVKSNVFSRCIQVVLADFALIAILLSDKIGDDNIKRCSITFDKNGLSIPLYYEDTKDERANVYLLKNFTFNQIIDLVIGQMDGTQYIQKKLDLLKKIE